MNTILPPDTQMGGVTLRTGNLPRLEEFYKTVLGMTVWGRDDAEIRLGAADGEPLLTLIGDEGAQPAPDFATGLYHFAILLPTRPDLAKAFAHMVAAHAPFSGFSDHLVSEALYLNDPDSNGIEIYRDRPRREWQWQDGSVRMTVDPLNVDTLYSEASASSLPWTGLPNGTVIGHVHLRVSDLAAAERFYHGLLGFDITTRFPGALFVSAGGYHHHLGLNTWQTRNAPPPPRDSSGLDEFTIQLPNLSDLPPIRARLQDAHWPVDATGDALRLHDPFGNALRIQAATGGTIT
jgi:catechol 2,3-dioxygenase